jgi:outer membrane receptor protein involved in Fe transport
VEIETVDSLFGPAGIADETYVHDISVSFEISDQYRLYGGINNIGDERPFITEFAFPVNPIGRFFFLGFDANIL